MIREVMVLALAVIPVNSKFIPSTDDTFPKPTSAGQWAESVVTKDPFLKSTYVDGKYIWVGSTQKEFDRWNRNVFAQTAVQGTKQYNTTSCHEENNSTVCDMQLLTTPIPIDPTVSTNSGTIQPLEGIPLGQTQAAWGVCGVTPSGQCVQIKVDEEGRVIVAPDEKSDAYIAGYQKGYIMGVKNGKETK